MVLYLLDTIKCTNPLLMARVADIQCDQNPNRKLHDFELAVAFLLPACPIGLCLARREPIAENKTARINTITLKRLLSELESNLDGILEKILLLNRRAKG